MDSNDRWIITTHKHKEHTSVDEVLKELTRLRDKEPGKSFHYYRINRDKLPGQTIEVSK